jgi:hypothetical protein
MSLQGTQYVLMRLFPIVVTAERKQKHLGANQQSSTSVNMFEG